MTEEEFKKILFSLEKCSNHPIARSLTRAWIMQPELRWKTIEEIRGQGIRATSLHGDEYKAGSAAFVGNVQGEHSVWLMKNNQIAGWVEMQDELRP
jgi:Cu+-exporting ATPase